MHVEATYRFAAPRPKVFELLLDPDGLKACIPGCERLEPVGNDRYEAVLKVGVAAVRGTYSGAVQIADRVEPEQFRMIVSGKGGPGFVRGEATISLAEVGDETEVRVQGDGQVGGLIAGVAQRLLSGVASMLMNQFFNCLQGRVANL